MDYLSWGWNPNLHISLDTLRLRRLCHSWHHDRITSWAIHSACMSSTQVHPPCQFFTYLRTTRTPTSSPTGRSSGRVPSRRSRGESFQFITQIRRRRLVEHVVRSLNPAIVRLAETFIDSRATSSQKCRSGVITSPCTSTCSFDPFVLFSSCRWWSYTFFALPQELEQVGK